MTVPALSIVEHFDVFKNIGSRCLTRAVNNFPNTLFLQAAEERFGRCIIVAITYGIVASMLPFSVPINLIQEHIQSGLYN
jgi:hypothetical protein